MNDDAEAIETADALFRATSEVFAGMVFMDVSRAGEGAAETGEIAAAIDILKPLSCRLELRMPRALYAGIVELLGSGDADAADEPEDAVLEMVNVLAGSFISERFGPGADMKLELPRYLYGEDRASGVPIAGVGCDAEGEPFSVLLTSVRYRY